MRPIARLGTSTVIAVLVASGCSPSLPSSTTGASGASSTTAESTTTTLGLPSAPWESANLDLSAVPSEALAIWATAANAATCPLLWPSDPGVMIAAVRQGTDVGGWALELDVAGAPGTETRGYWCPECGLTTIAIIGDALPPRPVDTASDTITYVDGSTLTISTEVPVGPLVTADTTTTGVAEPRPNGASCRYQVRSALGEANVRQVAQGLRKVNGAP